MKKITEIAEIHDILLGIAKEFHRICVKHNIPYYMVGGTLIGAVRHKGFIPWDDDMDFDVPREYYKRLKDALAKDLTSPYSMITIENTATHIADFIKIQDTRTVICEQYRKESEFAIGINIDVFPFDECNGNRSPFSKNWWAMKLSRIQPYIYFNSSFRPLHKKMVAYFLKGMMFWATKFTLPHFTEKHLRTKGNYRLNYYGVYGMKEILLNDWFGTPQPMVFEDTEFYAPSDYDSYLSSVYGDYMQLPPNDKRTFHLQDMFWKEEKQ